MTTNVAFSAWMPAAATSSDTILLLWFPVFRLVFFLLFYLYVCVVIMGGGFDGLVGAVGIKGCIVTCGCDVEVHGLYVLEYTVI